MYIICISMWQKKYIHTEQSTEIWDNIFDLNIKKVFRNCCLMFQASNLYSAPFWEFIDQVIFRCSYYSMFPAGACHLHYFINPLSRLCVCTKAKSLTGVDSVILLTVCLVATVHAVALGVTHVASWYALAVGTAVLPVGTRSTCVERVCVIVMVKIWF